MTAPAAMQADFVDLKFVKGRKVMQVILELPIEAGAKFVETFGTPNPASGVPVAIARINHWVDFPAKPEKPKGGQLAQRAGIICNEGAFKKFLAERWPEMWKAAKDDAAVMIRVACNVDSRADLDHDTEAAAKFRDLEGKYNAWLAAS